MKITETHDIDEDYGSGSVSVTISDDNGRRLDGVTFLADPECPEDFTFYRDVNCAFSVAGLLKIAYEAGKAGESYEYEFIDENEVTA